jgi:hypothetical protein
MTNSAMKPALHEISFDGGVLARGFWLYVWEIKTPDGRLMYYVGRTGDKASGVCQSPFDRFSKHLGANPNNNALQRHLKKHGLRQEDCSFRFHTFGPLLADSKLGHGEQCDVVAALEKALADSMTASGYEVLNQVNCRMPLDGPLWKKALSQFTKAFPKLASPPAPRLPRGIMSHATNISQSACRTRRQGRYSPCEHHAQRTDRA